MDRKPTTCRPSVSDTESGFVDKAVYNQVTYREITPHDYVECTEKNPGQIITKNAGSSTTYSGGVTLNGVEKASGGTLSVSATSSWSKASEEAFTLTGSVSDLCGSSGVGWITSAAISLQKRISGGGCITPQVAKSPDATPCVVAQ